MPYKIVLILAVVFQVLAALLALRLNRRYHWHSAWLMISAAAIVMSIQRIATLRTIWNQVEEQVVLEIALWTTCLSTLLVSILLLGGVALIEPLFRQIAEAQEILKQEKRELQDVVDENEEQLRLARQIQQNLLPQSPPTLAGLDVAGMSEPAEWTSGDYFDYIPMDDGTMTFVIADVSGHGTGPALLMSATRAFLRTLAHTHTDVGAMLTLANTSIAADVTHGRFVTVFLARIDPQACVLDYAAAGHDGYLLRADGTQQVFASDCPPLGVLPDTVIEKGPEWKLQEGEILILPTDGILEALSLGGEQFGVQRMFDVVRHNRSLPASQILDKLFGAVGEFTGSSPQRDDNTAVIIKVVAKVQDE